MRPPILIEIVSGPIGVQIAVRQRMKDGRYKESQHFVWDYRSVKGEFRYNRLAKLHAKLADAKWVVRPHPFMAGYSLWHP